MSRRRRLAALLLQGLLAAQAAFGALLPVAAPVAAAPAAAPATQAVAPAPAAGTGATGASGAGACTAQSSPTGAILSSCPTAGGYADIVNGLQVAMGSLRAGVDTGSLHVTSTPAGATVSVNGIESGVTPLDLPVPPGTYLVRLGADGYVPFTRVVQVAAGAPTNFSKALDAGGDGGDAGSYSWVRPASILAALGKAGNASGPFDITGYVRDKDGADYVSFINGNTVELKFDDPPDFNGFGPPLLSERKGVNLTGIARSTDDGATWTIVKTWQDTYTAKTWTSKQFTDGQWSQGNPGSIKSHWLRIQYHSWHWEQHFVASMVPRQDGGIAVYVNKVINDMPQEVIIAWDNLPPKWCREDDLVQQCIGIDHPTRYWGSPFTQSSTGKYKTLPSSVAMARWGMSQEDYATYNLVRTYDLQLMDSRSGGVSSLASDLMGATYAGSTKERDYYLTMDGQSTTGQGTIYSGKTGEVPRQDTTYTMGAGSAQGAARSEGLRIGADGTLYVIDHVKGRVFRLDKGTTVPMGTIPAAVYGGLVGPDYPQFNFLSAAVDSGGNVHAAYRVGTGLANGRDPTAINDYYVYFPHDKVVYDGVAVFTEPGCAACDAALTWLKSAGVTYRENPADLPADVASSVAAAKGAKGFPVVARLGKDAAVIGGATPPSISRLLGVSFPVLVDSHPPVMGVSSDGRGIGYQPDWVLLMLEQDSPRVILQKQTGVFAFEPAAGGTWTGTRVLSSPPPTVVVEGTDKDGTFTAFHPLYPMFPGGITTGYAAVTRDVPFNAFSKVSDLRFLYRSGDGARTGQFAYTLNTTKPGAGTSSTYRVVEAVSQLIPAAAFYVGLGPDGSADKVQGELAAYVTGQTVVTSNGYRFAKVVVDLRSQNEAMTDGNIPGRTLGGSLTVTTKNKDGTPDTRDISLILLVQNTRLRTYDPDSRAVSLDITTEAIHFTGANEHWVVTNNTALPNTISCGGPKAITVPPGAAATVTAAQVKAGGIADCLAALEVAPSVLEGCTSWDDVQLVLAAQSVDALATSLPLVRSENVTNWELAFGSKSATIYRLVSLDNIRGTPAAPSCATAVTGKTAAVVKVSGTFLGGGEAYKPKVELVDSGTTAVQTAPAAPAESLAFEREWLQFEASYLQADLALGVGDEAFASLMFLNRAGKRLGYQRQLLATEALLACNYDGIGIASVQSLMARNASIPEALRGTVTCLNRFALDPRRHWPEYNPRSWAGGTYDASFLGTIVDAGIAGNPTLSWLAAIAAGPAPDYGTWVAAHAKALATRAAADADLRMTATDFELDDYGRIATAASRDLGEVSGPVTRAVAMAGTLERSELRLVIECVKAQGGAKALATLYEKTSAMAYAGGIACVEARAGAGQAQVDRYRMLVLGLRSGTFSALVDAAGRDMDLVTANLALLTSALDQVAAAEGRWAEGTTIAAYQVDLPALDRMVIALRAMGTTVAARGQQVNVRDAIKGLTECGIGFVKSIPEGIVIIGLAGAAALAGPAAAAVGGVLFLGFGTATTHLSAKDLAAQWETLDPASKTAGACGVAISTVMTAAGASHAATSTLRAYRAYTPSAVRAAPPRTIALETIETRGVTAAMPFEEKAAITTPAGGKLVEPVAAAPAPLDGAIQNVLAGIPAGPERAQAVAALETIGYSQMTPFEQGVVQKLLPSTGRVLTIYTNKGRYAYGSPEALAWERVGSALISALDDESPRSVSAKPAPPAPAGAGGAAAKPARLSGADATVQAAVDKAADVQPGGARPADGDPAQAAYDATMAARQPYLLEAVLGSERLAQALRDPSIKSLYTAEEVAALFARASQANAKATPAFFTELASPRFLTTLRTAVKAAQDGAKLPGAVAFVESRLFSPGANKVAARLTIHLDAGGTLDVVVAKGTIAAGEAAIYADLGPKGITPNLLAPLLEKVDGAQAVMVTDYAPTSRGALAERAFATVEAPYAEAIGALDARIWLKTQSNGQATFNTDLHVGNINVNEGVKPARAVAVDFDPAFSRPAAEDAYWLGNAFRRNGDGPNGALAAQNYNAWLDGVLAELTANGSTPAAVFDLMKRTADQAATPAGQAKAAAMDGSLGSGAALDALGKTVSNDIKAWLASKGQSRAGGPILAVAVLADPPMAATVEAPAGAPEPALPAWLGVIVLPRRVRPVRPGRRQASDSIAA